MTIYIICNNCKEVYTAHDLYGKYQVRKTNKGIFHYYVCKCGHDNQHILHKDEILRGTRNYFNDDFFKRFKNKYGLNDIELSENIDRIRIKYKIGV